MKKTPRSSRAGQRRAPFASFLLSAVLLATIAGLLGLGFWQLDRAESKERLLEQRDAALVLNPATLDVKALHRLKSTTDRYRRIQVQGRFDGDRQFLLDNRRKRGVLGYYILTPLALSNNTFMLVARGFIAADINRIPPDISLPPGVPTLKSAGGLKVSGSIGFPSRGFVLGPLAEPRGDPWPAVIQAFDAEEIGRLLRAEVLPAVLYAEGGGSWNRDPVAPAIRGGVWRHRGYAFQWFALALTLSVLLVFYNKYNKKSRRARSSRN